MKFAWRIYRRLAQAFPHEFKLAYGSEVMQLGEDVVEEIAKRHGVPGLIRLIADIAIRVPLEYLSEMPGDMRYAWRALVKSPGFALVGIISTGLGIGLTTNVYSSKWAMLFRELPSAANAKSLVMIQLSEDADLAPVSYYYVEQYRELKSLFAGVAAFQTGIPFNVTLQGNLSAKPERVFGQLVSPDYFSVLGVQPQLGRVLSAAIDKPGDAPIVVISDRFWRNRLNSSPDALGQILRLNGQIATIVGITPKILMAHSPGRTGPHAVAGKEILATVPCDESFPDVIANVIQSSRAEYEYAQQASADDPLFTAAATVGLASWRSSSSFAPSAGAT